MYLSHYQKNHVVTMYLTSLTILFLGGNWRVPVELARDTPDSYGNVKSRKHGMIDNRAGLTISTKAIGAAAQNWMLEVSDGGRNSITSESDNLFTKTSSWDTSKIPRL
jgi:hypothetical protein